MLVDTSLSCTWSTQNMLARHRGFGEAGEAAPDSNVQDQSDRHREGRARSDWTLPRSLRRRILRVQDTARRSPLGRLDHQGDIALLFLDGHSFRSLSANLEVGTHTVVGLGKAL